MKAPKKQITVAAMAATLTLTTTVTAPPVLVCAQESLDTTQQDVSATSDTTQATAEETSKDNIKDAVSADEKKAEGKETNDTTKADKDDSKKDKKTNAVKKAAPSKEQKETSQKKEVKKAKQKTRKNTQKKVAKSTQKKVAKAAQKKAESNVSKKMEKAVQKKAEEITEIKISEKTFPDKAFRDYVSGKFDTDKNGSLSQKEIKAVTKIDVSSQAGSITSLKGIEHFTSLTELNCSGTAITGLDVSKNTALRSLNCKNTKLAWLNTGNNTSLKKVETEISLTADSSSFDLEDEFTGIDVDKVKNMTGATLTKETVSGYSYDTPVTYEYSAADSKKEDPVLKVTLNLKEEKAAAEPEKKSESSDSKTPESKASDTKSTPETKNSDSETGADNPKARVKPEYTVPTDLKATYGQKLSDVTLPEGFSWQDAETTPVGNVGNNPFKVTYTPSDTDAYETVTDIEVKIAVSPAATNSWTKELSITGWIYGKTKNDPSATAAHGTVTYAYSSSENGTYSADVPTTAGTWYVKASVAETNDYAGLESKPVAFTIAKAVPDYQAPSGLKAAYGQKLKEVSLPDGFSWDSASKSVGKVGKNTFKATFTPSDTSNYETVKDIDVTVTVEQAENSRTKKLTIKDWTYGDKANKPEFEAEFGKAEFTYSDKEDGTYKSDVPTTAGTWYVKAEIEETDNYTGLESKPVSFKIKPKDGTKLTIPTITSTTDTTKLVIKDGNTTLVSGKDYDITKRQVGTTVTVTIAFKGNYTGTVTRTYTTTSTSSTTRTTTGTAPRTGDSTDVGLWSSSLLLSGGLLAFITRKRRKEAKSEEE